MLFRRLTEALNLDWLGQKRVENYVFLAIASALAITSMGFWFAIPCQGWVLPCCVAIVGGLLLMRSWKLSCAYVVLIGVCLLLATFCFSYPKADSVVCHATMQRLLIEGWNPVFESSIDDIVSKTNGGQCSIYHTLFMPKLHHLVGALVAKSTGLFLADTFLSFFILYALFVVAYRFAKFQWNGNRLLTIGFALFIALPAKFSTVLNSMLDYTLFASTVIGLLSYMTWQKSQKVEDLFSMFVGFAFSMLIKPSGLFTSLVIVLVIVLMNVRDIKFRRGFLMLFAFVALVGSSPYITAWVRYGSFLYPTHTFNPACPLIDITNDFTCNADGASMGYFSRIIYAWFSKKLAVWGCALWSGNPNFSPEFYVAGGVDGLKMWFRPMMWIALFALLFSKRTRISLLCVILFVISNIGPLRYIGYGRYFMLIWLVPPLAVYNFIFNPYDKFKKLSVMAAYVAPIVCILFASAVALKSTAHYAYLMARESARQKAFEHARLSGHSVVSDSKPSNFFLTERLNNVRVNGAITPKNDLPPQAIDESLWLPVCDGIDVEQIERDFPKCEHLSQLPQFHWRKLFADLPHPLWNRE